MSTAAAAQVIETNRLNKLNHFLASHYYAPDLHAIEIILATIVSHYFETSDPVWIMVVGRPRSGKTSLGINPLQGFPETHMLSDITPKAFLSGYSKNGRGGGTGANSTSFLSRVGKSGILLFKDFTTIMSKRPEHRDEILSHLREMHDGAIYKTTGMGGAAELMWQGKVTCIAAVTGAIERVTSVRQELGERFLHLKWRSGDDHKIAEMAGLVRGDESQVRQATKLLYQQAVDYKELIQTFSKLPRPDRKMVSRLATLAEIAAWGRVHVERANGWGEIRDIQERESPAGIVKSLVSLVSARAALHRRKEVLNEDVDWISRLCLDAMPGTRAHLIRNTQRDGVTRHQEMLADLPNVPYMTLRRHEDDLFALGILERHGEDGDDVRWGFTEQFMAKWQEAFPQ